jgi:hypothetical protein
MHFKQCISLHASAFYLIQPVTSPYDTWPFLTSLLRSMMKAASGEAGYIAIDELL